jgi:hypothetical protein
MSTNLLRFLSAGAFCLVIFLSGFRLSRTGKPYNGLLFNLHKLLALAAVVLFAVMLVQANRLTPLTTNALITSIAAGLFFLGLFATGGLASGLKQTPTVVRTIHHILPYLAVFFTAAALYLL